MFTIQNINKSYDFIITTAFSVATDLPSRIHLYTELWLLFCFLHLHLYSVKMVVCWYSGVTDRKQNMWQLHHFPDAEFNLCKTTA